MNERRQLEKSPGLTESSAEALDAELGISAGAVSGKSEEGPVHRNLIRASLGDRSGSPETPRPAPVFTMHQQQAQAGSGATRKKSKVRDGRQAKKNGASKQASEKKRPWRSNRKKDRNGLANGNSSSSRNGKGRSR